jgi:hypothetical protein
LPTQHTPLDRGHVEPTAVFRGVVDLELAVQPARVRWREAFVERAGVCVLSLSKTSTMRSASG